MKKILALMAGFLFIASNLLFAGDGDLIVEGNVGIGTNVPSAPLDINTISHVKITPEGYLEMGLPNFTGYLISIGNSNGYNYTNPGYGGQGYFANSALGNVIEMIRGKGSVANPLPVTSNSYLFSYDLYAQYDTTPGNQVLVGRFGAQMTQATDPDPNKWKAKAFFHMDTLEVAGAMKIANTTSECNTSNAGAIKFESPNFKGCNGSQWVQLNN